MEGEIVMILINMLWLVLGLISGFISARIFVAKGILQVDDTNEEKAIFRFVVEDIEDIPNHSHILLKIKKTKITQ